ncbi:MAG: patatin-like phospholipase family protein [Kiloniellales bacterium]|nr:patatin-like phospholipase family protein [Kiloniellales bacterium]
MARQQRKRPGRKSRVSLALALGFTLAACAHFEENPPFPAGQPDAGYRYDKLTPYTTGNSEEVFVILTFSGGGTRAAALSYGVLEKLRRTTIEVNGERRSLLQEVDVISSNSGGSYTAAYYGLFRQEMFGDGSDPDLYFTDRFLYRDIQGAIVERALFNPVNWFKLMSPTYNRSDLAAELYDEELFDRGTFGDLVPNGRPFVIVNANDTTKGVRFEFTQENFDLICSNLDDFPLSRAVMASSAVHGVFGAIRLVNYEDTNCQEPRWVALALGEATGDRGDLDRNRQRYKLARVARSYREKDDPGATYYVHLSDGGAVDNLGLRSPLQSLRSLDPSWSLLAKLDRKEVKKILVLSINAASEPDNDLDRSAKGPNLVELIASAINGAIDTITLDSIDVATSVVNEQIRAVRSLGWDAEIFGPVLIDFEHIDDPGQRHCFKNIPTTLALDKDTVDGLRKVAYELVHSSKGFQNFLGAMDGREEPMPDPLPGQPACQS